MTGTKGERAKGVMTASTASRPSFRNNHDRLAFAVHSSFLADGCSLSSTGIPAFTSDPAREEEVGIDGWKRKMLYTRDVDAKCIITRSGTDERATRNGSEPSVLGEPRGPQIHPSGVVLPPVYPVGGSDLFPGPGTGMFPSRGGFVGGGSMLLGPNDPSWLGGGLRQPGFPGGQPGVLPGARFDPFGPPDIPGFEPGRFDRNPRRPGGNTHPDLEHFRRNSDFI